MSLSYCDNWIQISNKQAGALTLIWETLWYVCVVHVHTHTHTHAIELHFYDDHILVMSSTLACPLADVG